MVQSIICFLLTTVLLIATTTKVLALEENVLLDFRAGAAKLGIFYQGDQNDKDLDVEVEAFKGFVEPFSRNTQLIKTGEGFVVRSVDFELRVKVIVWKNTDLKSRNERPYKLTLKNLVMDSAVELKASEKGGYTWIDEGTYVTQLTDVQHDFEFRDHSGDTLLAIRLFPANVDEL